MPANDFDGVFLDTAHIRIDGFSPFEWFEGFCGEDIAELDQCWNQPAINYFERLMQGLRKNNDWYYAIGNFGPLITGWDSNDYLAPLDGGMVELFMGSESPLNESDWHIAAERILRLIGNDKIFIAEPIGYELNDIFTRKWMIANFLLFKGQKSFAAFYPAGFEFGETDPFWFPEYEIDLGAPDNPVPVALSVLCTGVLQAHSCSGVYTRHFQKGVILVNPSSASREVILPEPPDGKRYAEIEFSGGGRVDAAGNKAQQTLSLRELAGKNLTISGSSGMVITYTN